LTPHRPTSLSTTALYECLSAENTCGNGVGIGSQRTVAHRRTGSESVLHCGRLDRKPRPLLLCNNMAVPTWRRAYFVSLPAVSLRIVGTQFCRDPNGLGRFPTPTVPCSGLANEQLLSSRPHSPQHGNTAQTDGMQVPHRGRTPPVPADQEKRAQQA
jgi:hypothetical protein